MISFRDTRRLVCEARPLLISDQVIDMDIRPSLEGGLALPSIQPTEPASSSANYKGWETMLSTS